jgi:hypothetical protein
MSEVKYLQITYMMIPSFQLGILVQQKIARQETSRYEVQVRRLELAVSTVFTILSMLPDERNF